MTDTHEIVCLFFHGNVVTGLVQHERKESNKMSVNEFFSYHCKDRKGLRRSGILGMPFVSSFRWCSLKKEFLLLVLLLRNPSIKLSSNKYLTLLHQFLKNNWWNRNVPMSLFPKAVSFIVFMMSLVAVSRTKHVLEKPFLLFDRDFDKKYAKKKLVRQSFSSKTKEFFDPSYGKMVFNHRTCSCGRDYPF